MNTSDKETQIDHVSMLKEYDLIRYQQQHPDQFRPYGRKKKNDVDLRKQTKTSFFIFLVEMPRIRKDSETLSNSGYSTVSRGRRESERLRTDMAYGVDNTNAITHRNAPNSSMIREVKRRISSEFIRHFSSSFVLRKLKSIVYHKIPIQLLSRVRYHRKRRVY